MATVVALAVEGQGALYARHVDVELQHLANSMSASSAGIEIAHDDAEHLTGNSGLTLGHRRVSTQLAIGVGQIPVPPRNGRQAGAAAANEPRAFRRGEAVFEAGSRQLAAGSRFVAASCLLPTARSIFVAASCLLPAARC